MPDDAIRAALEAAACALCKEAKSCRGDCGDRCAWRVPDVSMPACAAAAVAAFLKALPDQYTRGGAAFWDAIPAEEETRLWLAAAVERAAR